MNTLTVSEISSLCNTVQLNCSISDARHARDYSLCVYLLRMREYYRWHYSLPLLQQLDTNTVGSWISKMESRWDEIEEQNYQPIVVQDHPYDPFDAQAINQHLQNAGLVYSAGYGRLGQPHFFLAELTRRKEYNSAICIEVGKELARDSLAVPALAQEKNIYIRHDCIRLHIWQLHDEWCLQKRDGPMARLVKHYKLHNEAELESNIGRAASELSTLYVEHELGEVKAGELLGDTYHQLMMNLSGTRGEFYLRAVRDCLADSLHTWPYIVQTQSEHFVDFWLAGIGGARQQILDKTGLPQLLQAEDSDRPRWERLSSVIQHEQERWLVVAQHLLQRYSIEPEGEPEGDPAGEPESAPEGFDVEQITLEAIQNAGRGEIWH